MSAHLEHLLAVEDLDGTTIRRLVDRAARIVDGEAPHTSGFVGGLMFLSASLRTRLGFATAMARLGGTPIPIEQVRFGPGMSQPEGLPDTLRVVTGMLDVLVIRTPDPLVRAVVEANAKCPVINGGDGSGNHPVQALIDLFAIERQAGPTRALNIGICGDLKGRSARSLLRVLCEFPPKRLRLIAPPSRMQHGVDLTAIPRVEATLARELHGLDVIYMAGLPPSEGDDLLDETVRRAYRLTGGDLDQLSSNCAILSPLPLIDEIEEGVRDDPRFAAFRQSDEGQAVRMAVLETALARWSPRR